MPRYLFGPVAADFAKEHLREAVETGDCRIFGEQGDSACTAAWQLPTKSTSMSPRNPFELDIGSLDGTAEYLAGLQAAAPCRIEIVRTMTDLEIADACKDALSRCRGEYIVLLNNDTVVTPSWLLGLTSLAKMVSHIGLVGPMSNYAAPPQLVESVPYRSGPRKASRPSPHAPHPSNLVDMDEVARFALEFHESHKMKWMEVERLAGFCLLIKREVYRILQQRGELEQWTDLSLFDTDILSVKARQAKYALACCCDLFIHHFGTRTFAHGAPNEAMTVTADGRR